MQPQQPYHPAPPDPTDVPPAAPMPAAHTPPSYPAPEFVSLSNPQEHPQNADYSFIMDKPLTPPKTKLSGSTKSMPMRFIIVLGGVFVLLLIFVAAKNAINSSSTSDVTDLLIVAEDQQEITHLATKAVNQQATDAETLNSAATIEASVSSAQTHLLDYIAKSHVKIKTGTITRKVSAATDTQLLNAATSGLYNQTYQSIMQTWLGTYQKDLRQAYLLTSGQKGRSLLQADSKDATLLLQQLNSPTS